MTDPSKIEWSRHQAGEAPAMAVELLAVHVDARAELLDQPFYSAGRFWERFENYLTGPAFELVAARQGGVLVGYAFGTSLPANTRWWDGLEGTVTADFMFETGSRTFGFRELLVLKSRQRQGIGRRLHDELLQTRPEERASLAVRGDNPARLLYLRWGWRPVGRLQPFPDSPRFEVMVLGLR